MIPLPRRSKTRSKIPLSPQILVCLLCHPNCMGQAELPEKQEQMRNAFSRYRYPKISQLRTLPLDMITPCCLTVSRTPCQLSETINLQHKAEGRLYTWGMTPDLHGFNVIPLFQTLILLLSHKYEIFI